MTDDERRMRHKMVYGEDSEPPAVRTGRNAPDEERDGRPFGVPRTDDERRMRHKELYGDMSEPPAERIGRNPMLTARPGYYPVIVGEEDGGTSVTYTRQGEPPDTSDTLVWGALISGVGRIGAWILEHQLVSVVVVAGTTMLFGGLTAAEAAREKLARRGLIPFRLIVGAPKGDDINDPEGKYVFGVEGAVPGRKVSIKFGKGKRVILRDPVFREEYGDFMVEITARELAEAAQKSKSLFGRIPGLRETGDVTTYMYAQERRKQLTIRDLISPVAAVKVHIPSMAERAVSDITGSIPCLTAGKGVSVDDANAGVATGEGYYIKSALPMLCCLPGVPYIPGMWVPPLCIISDKP